MNPLWITQILAVLRLEMRKTFLSKRGFWIYLLAFLPVILFTAKSIVEMKMQHTPDFGQDTNVFATTFQLFFLRLVWSFTRFLRRALWSRYKFLIRQRNFFRG